MAAEELRPKNVNIYIDDQAAEDALQRLQKSADGFNKKIDEGRKKQKELTDEIAKAKTAGQSYTKLEKDLKKVNAELAKSEKEVNDNTAAQKKLQQQIASGTGSSLRQQEALVKRLTNEFRNMAAGTAEAEKKLQELGKASHVLDGMRDRLNAVTRAQSDAGKSSGFMSSFFGNLAANVVVKATAAVSEFFNGAIDEALEAEEATARLKNRLDNLGETQAFDNMVRKAEEVAEKFTYLDNDEVLGVFDKLISYGKLTEQQMNDLLPVIIDFAANQRISLEESSSVIIKAIQGQGKALKDFGIDMKDAKTESEGLELVMTTLAGKVQGAGQAFQDTAAGGIASAKQEFKNLQEEVGTGLLPILNSLLGLANKLLQGFSYLGQKAKEIASDIGDLFTGDLAVLIGEGEGQLKRLEERRKRIESVAAKGIAQDELAAAESAGEAINVLNERLLAYQKILERSKKEGSIFSEDDAKRAEKNIRVTRMALDELFKVQAGGGNSVIGISQPDKPDTKKDDAAAKKREDELRKQREFIEKIDKLYAESKARTAIDKELVEVSLKYAELRKQADELIKDEQLKNVQLLHIDELYQLERAKIIVKYGDLAKDQYEKINAEIIKKQDDQFKKSIQSLKNNQRDLVNDMADRDAQVNANRDAHRRAKIELDVLRSTGIKKLQAHKRLLDDQKHEDEKALAERAEKEKLNSQQIKTQQELIDEQYRQAKMQSELDFWTNLLSQTLSIVQQLVDVFGPNEEVLKAREDAELARLQKNNDKKKASDQKLLNNKLISQQEYNRRVQKLDDDYNKLAADNKKKQFERQQKADITAAIIRGAQAVLSALSTPPFPLGLVLAVLAGAKTKKEIDTIKAQPVPEFAKGTLLSGPSHANGGIDMVDSKTGRKVAEAEGGEALLSKKTVQNNPELVGALLHASMYRNGENIQPAWQSRPYVGVDHAGIVESSRKMKYFESGGVLAETINNNNSTVQQTQVIATMPPEQVALLQSLQFRLDNPVPAKNFVLLRDIEAANDQMNNILDDAIFK